MEFSDVTIVSNSSSGDPEEGGRRMRSGKTPGRRPLTEGNAEDTRRTIRRHAVRLFLERGYSSVSIDDIAGAAGLTRATLYYHYKGKADIFVASVIATFDAIKVLIAEAISQKHLTVRERVKILFAHRRHIEGKLAKREFDADSPFEVPEEMLFSAMSHLSAKQQARITEAHLSLHHLTRELMQDGIDSGEFRPLPAEVLDFAFWQMFHPSEQEEHLPDYDEEQLEEHLMDIFFMGAAPR